jgi:hypothetical protein
MRETSLVSTKMEGAIFTGAMFIRADLTNSDITAFQYKRARTLEETIMPDGRVYGE